MAGRFLGALTRSSRAIGGAGAVPLALGGLATIMSERNAADALLSDEEARRLAELKKRRAEGNLGLTERQMGQAEQRILAPQRALQADQARATRDALGTMDVGPGAFVSAQQAQTGAMARTQQAGLQDVQALDEARRQENAAELRTLDAKKTAQTAAKKNALWNALATGSKTALDISKAVEPGLSAAKEREIMMQMQIAREYGEQDDLTTRFLLDY